MTSLQGAGAEDNSIPPPDKVNSFHTYSDVDNNVASLHHTLGRGHTQAAPGAHNHDGRDSPILSAYSVAAHTHSSVDVEFTPVGDISSSDVQSALSELDGEKQNKFVAASVTGSRANPEEALKNLLTALAAQGIIVDNTVI